MSNSQLLYEEECKIDNAVLHHQEIDGPGAKDRFKRTVMAVYEIVEQKLYKTRHNSLETYFRSVWRISRAQVYRFYNCARILKELAAFDLQPSRERLCRAIKKLAHSADDRRLLWKTVIEKTHEDESLISSTIIANVWKELVKQGLVSQQHPSYMINEEAIDGYSDKDHVEVATGNDGSVKSMPSTPTAARQDRELIGASNLAKVSSVQASLSGPGMLQIGKTHSQHAQQYLSSSPPRSQKRTHHAMNDHHQSVSQRDRFKNIAKAPDESIDLAGAQGGSLQDSNNSSGWMKRDMDTIFACLQRLQKNGVEMQAMGDSGQWIRNIQDVRFVQTSQQKNGAGDINMRPAQQPAQSNKLRYDSGSNGHQFNDYRGPKLPTIEGHKSPQRPLHYPAQSQIQQYNFGDFYQQIYPTSQYNAFRPADQFGSYPSRSVPFAHDKRPESGYMFQSQQNLPNQLSAPPPYQVAQNPYQQQQQDPRQQHQQQTLYQQNQQHFHEDAQLKSPHPASLQQQQQQQQQQQSQQQQKSDIKFLLCQRLQSDADHQQL